MRTYNFLMCKVFSSSFLHVIFVGYALDNLSTYVIWSVILMVLCTLSMIGILFFFLWYYLAQRFSYSLLFYA